MAGGCPHNCIRCKAIERGVSLPLTQQAYIELVGLQEALPGPPEYSPEETEALEALRTAREEHKTAEAVWFAARQDAQKAGRDASRSDGSGQLQRIDDGGVFHRAQEQEREAAARLDDAGVILRAASIHYSQLVAARDRQERAVRDAELREAAETKWNGTREARRLLDRLTRRSNTSGR